MRSFLDGITELTAKEDFVWHLKLNLLIQVACKKRHSFFNLTHFLLRSLLIEPFCKHRCTKLFLGESSTRLAIKTISLTSKGRGFSLPLEISGENTWFQGWPEIVFGIHQEIDTNQIHHLYSIDVIIMRPMKDMIAKEIGIYNQFQGLETLNTRTLTSRMRANVSIDRLTEGTHPLCMLF